MTYQTVYLVGSSESLDVPAEYVEWSERRMSGMGHMGRFISREELISEIERMIQQRDSAVPNRRGNTEDTERKVIE